jgi:hypothetical protein
LCRHCELPNRLGLKLRSAAGGRVMQAIATDLFATVSLVWVVSAIANITDSFFLRCFYW